MKTLLAILLLLPTLVLAADSEIKLHDGRYEFIKAEGGQYLLDTKMGELWMLMDNSDGVKILVRTPFFHKTGQCFSAPDAQTAIPCGIKK